MKTLKPGAVCCSFWIKGSVLRNYISPSVIINEIIRACNDIFHFWFLKTHQGHSNLVLYHLNKIPFFSYGTWKKNILVEEKFPFQCLSPKFKFYQSWYKLANQYHVEHMC